MYGHFNKKYLPTCSQSSTECTLKCAFPAHPSCAGMTDYHAHAWDDVLP